MLKKTVALLLAAACSLEAAPAAAQRIAAPVLAPLTGPSLPVALAPSVSLSAPRVSIQLPSPILSPALPAAVNAIVAPKIAVPQAADRALSRGSAASEALGAASVQQGLRAFAAETAKARESGGDAAPALARVFDSAPARSGGAVDAVAAPGAEVSGRSGLVRALESIRELRVGTYNVLNLFEKVGKHVPDPDRPGRLKKVSDRTAKEEWALREQAKAILESELDVVALQEVENIRALEDFNRRYLGGRYQTFLIEGNDERGIDVAFLMKKDLPLRVEQRTHQEETWTDPVTGQAGRLFSRDLPSLIVRAEGAARPLFVLLGTHMKSKRDRPGDPESAVLRRAQAERTAQIVERYKAEFGADVPLMLAGDFNGDLNGEDTFAPLWRAGLTNGLDLGDRPVPLPERVTHTYHPRGGPTHAAQMDGVLVSEGLRALVRRAEVYRYKDADGKARPIPTTYEERSRNPSDHFPLILTLAFQPLLRDRALSRGSAASEALGAANGVMESAAPRPSSERRLAVLGMAWSFLAIASMYIVMPVKSAFLLTQFGAGVMPWVYIASAVFTGLAAWLYAKGSRFSRARHIGGTLAVLAAMLVGWWALAPLAMSWGPASFAFSMWTDAFSIMSVTMFWSYANDRFKGETAKRWFGGFAAAGALGSVAGSAVTKFLVASLGTVPLLLISAAAFAAIGAVFWAMERTPGPEEETAIPAAPAETAASKADASSPWAVAKTVAASPFLLALTGLVFLERLVPDLNNYLFTVMASQAYPTKEALAGFLATFGMWTGIVSLFTSALFTSWILKKLGVGKTLLGAPLAALLGFVSFALSPTLGVTVAANAVEGWQRYGWFKAAKETTYSAADKNVIYRVKAYVEMFVYRFARGIAGLLLLLLTGPAFLALGPAALAWAAVPLGLAWVYAAWRLGREYRKVAPTPSR